MQPWKTLTSKTAFAAEPFVSVSIETVELPSGQVIDDFYRVHLRPFALIVPVLEDGGILLLRQYKHGPGRVSLTFPAGFVEPGEPPEQAARRELLEETGCEGAWWEPMGTFVDNGNQRGCQGAFFIAHGCRQVQPAASGDLEEMRPEVLSVAEVDAAFRAGDFAITHMVAAWGMARMRLVDPARDA